MGTVYTYRLLWAEQVQIHIDRRFRMGSSAGSLDLERSGVNRDVATAFTYNGAGTSLYGAKYTPAIGGSRWSYANPDGTRRKHYFGTFLHPDSYQDLTSAYNVAGGISKMTAAEFQANMPRRVYQNTL